MDSSFSTDDISSSKETEIFVQENKRLGKCRFCQLFTAERCKRCGDYYCSEKCQLNDWPGHRYICFPIPPLVHEFIAVKDDEVFPVKLNVSAENYSIILKELHEIKETILQLQCMFEQSCIEKQNGLKKTPSLPNDNCDLETNSDCLQSYEEKLTVSQESVSVVNENCSLKKNTHNVEPVNLETMQFDSSISSFNKSLIDDTTNKSSSDETVVLCAFRSTNRCAVRSKNPETEIKLHAIMEQIDNYGKNAPQMENMPKPGSYAITLKSQKQYTRVLVLKPYNKDKIRVVFCDYGNTVCRKLSDLRVITQEMISLPECVKTFQLHGVHMTTFNEKTTNFFKNFVHKDFRIEYINDNGKNNIKLYDIATGELLNEKIEHFFSKNDTSKPAIEHQLSKTNTSTTRNEDDKQKTSKLESATRQEDEKVEFNAVAATLLQAQLFAVGWTNINVVVVDTSQIENGYVSCILKNDLGYLSEIQRFLNKTEFGNEPYEPKLKEYCIAQFENEWYRGVVVGVVDGGTKYEICYIDFLNSSTVSSQYIRSYPKDLNIGCYTTLCIFDNLPKTLNNEQRNFLKSAVNLNDILIIDRVVEIIEEKSARVECSDIIARMHIENLV